ncbi:hypothetical protein [Pacificibacter sp. AS14]
MVIFEYINGFYTPGGPLSTGLEKPRRIRTESGLNELGAARKRDPST